MTTVPASSSAAGPAIPLIAKVTLGATVVGTVANLILYAAGRLAGVEFVVPDGSGATMAIPAAGIVVASVVPMLVGALAAVLAIPRWAPARLTLQIIGAVLAVGSVVSPLATDTDNGTRILLALMHIVLGVAYVGALALVPRTSTR
jgi:hypothetical protein